MKLAEAFDAEVKRIAKDTDVTMEELVTEMANLIGCSTRHIYNFRSGKWSLPGDLIPILCRRFKSRALLDALIDECSDTQIEVPESFDLTRLVSHTVRDDLKHYESFLDAFESDGGVDGRELEALRASGARVIQNVHQFEAIAKADFARRNTAHIGR